MSDGKTLSMAIASIHKSDIDAVAVEMLPMVLAKGFKMEIDYRTGNILVSGKNLGFCITSNTIKEGRWKTGIGPSLAALSREESKLNGQI